MAQKRNVIFDSLYGGQNNADEEEMLIGNEDFLTKKNDDETIEADSKLKEEKELKAESNIEINGNDYHITF